MITHNAQALNQSTDPKVVIVGGGTLGLYVAGQLLQCGIRATVVEAGAEHLSNFDADSFESTGRPHEGIRVGRSRSLGGTSNLWGGQLAEFQPIDFAGRDWMPGSAWPIDYAEVRRLYNQTYANLGIETAFQSDGNVWQSLGKRRPTLDGGMEVFLTRWMKVPSFNQLLRHSFEGQNGFNVLLDHTVVGFEYAGGRVTSVRLRADDGSHRTLAADIVIIAAGTIENSRILLEAAQSDPDCPWRNNHNIGLWFQDHLGGRIGYMHPKSLKQFCDVFATIVIGMQKFAPKIRYTTEYQSAVRTLNIQAMIDFESSISENLVYLKQFLKAAINSRKISGVGDFFKNARACAVHLFPLMWRFVHDHRIFVPSDSKIAILVQSEHIPRRESRISIVPDARDRFGLSKVRLNWSVGEQESVDILRFGQRLTTAMENSGFGRLELTEELSNGDSKFLTRLRDTTHQLGGTIMGDSARDAVVDKDLRVFGCSNLYVSGASVFRTGSNANTTFTALAFGTRLAGHIGNRLCRC